MFDKVPSDKHVVVIQDVASRYPVAKLVRSTRADQVLPVLEQAYDTFGNPRIQISDNGPPFNSKRMSEVASKRDIELRFVPPLHPNGNPVETFMKPLGKAMKAYRQTPHPNTGIPPASMMFRDFPVKKSSESDVERAREREMLC